MLSLCFLYVDFHKGEPTFLVGFFFLFGVGGGGDGGVLMSESDDAQDVLYLCDHWKLP